MQTICMTADKIKEIYISTHPNNHASVIGLISSYPPKPKPHRAYKVPKFP